MGPTLEDPYGSYMSKKAYKGAHVGPEWVQCSDSFHMFARFALAAHAQQSNVISMYLAVKIMVGLFNRLQNGVVFFLCFFFCSYFFFFLRKKKKKRFDVSCKPP